MGWAAGTVAKDWELRLTAKAAAKLRRTIHADARNEPQLTPEALGEQRPGLQLSANMAVKCPPDSMATQTVRHAAV